MLWSMYGRHTVKQSYRSLLHRPAILSIMSDQRGFHYKHLSTRFVFLFEINRFNDHSLKMRLHA